MSQSSSDLVIQKVLSDKEPKLTVVRWEDEGCMCFQVEVQGCCVARRDGMIHR